MRQTFEDFYNKKNDGAIEVEDYEALFKTITSELLEMPMGTEVEIKKSIAEVREIVVALDELYRSAGRLQRLLTTPYILLLNDIYDAFGRSMDGETRGILKNNLDFIEKMIKININQLSPEVFTNALYYFCKFQAGSDELWTALEAGLLRQKESFSV